MAGKESVKHPIFRQFDADDVIEIVLTDGDGEEIAVAPGYRSESDIKLLAQQNQCFGPVNLLARLANGTTNGPVQISVPAKRIPAENVFKKSRLMSLSPVESAFNETEPPTRLRSDMTPTIAMDSMQRLDKLATDSVVNERIRLDRERDFWQQKMEEEREAARQREQELVEAARQREQEIVESTKAREQEILDMLRNREQEMAAKLAEERAFAREREEDLAGRFEEQMEIIREAQDQLLRETKANMTSKIASLTDTYEKTLQEYRAAEESKIRHVSSGSDEKVSLVREMSEQSTRMLESANAQTISALKAQLEVASSRIRDLETNREREAEAARTRYEDYRDRMTDEVNRLREEKAKVEQSRLELMLTSQKASAEDIRREVDRVVSKYDADIKEIKSKYDSDIKELKLRSDAELKDLRTKYESELRDQKKTSDAEIRERNRIIETLQQKCDSLGDKFREESTRAEMSMLREQANREPLKTERLMPLLSALPMEQRAALVGKAVAADLDLDLDDDKEPAEKKPSLMDSIGGALNMLAMSSLAPKPQAAAPAPQPQPQPQPIIRPQAPRPQPQPQAARPQPQAARPQPQPQPQAAPVPPAPSEPVRGPLGDSEEV